MISLCNNVRFKNNFVVHFHLNFRKKRIYYSNGLISIFEYFLGSQ